MRIDNVTIMHCMGELVGEIRRITECPYVPSLKRLHDLLHTADNRLLQRWARGNECQIEPLAEAVLEGLDLWPYTLDILSTLCYITNFRDAVMHQNPSLLSILLAKAIESDSAFEKYAATCVSLLSAPLDVAIPSAFSHFLERTLMKAVDNVSAETIRPLYVILSALGSSQIDGLPLDIVSSLQEGLMKALRSLDVEHHSANLLCLAVLAKLVSRASTDSSSDNYILFGAQQSFFGGRRASKTLDHIVLKVILACSKNCPLAPNDAITSVELSEEIVDAIDVNERDAWIVKNTAKTKKLCEKILRPDIETELQCAALNFLSTLSHDIQLSRELLVAYKDQLVTTKSVRLGSNALTALIDQVEPHSISLIVLAVIQIACCPKAPYPEALAEVQNALHFVNALIATLPASSPLCQTLLPPTPGNEFMDGLKRIAFPDPIYVQNAATNGLNEVCPTVLVKYQEQLRQRLCRLFAKLMLHTPQHRDPAYLSIFDSLLERQTKTTEMIEISCKHRISRHGQAPPTVNVSLFEANSTPETNSVSHAWKGNLIKQISRDADLRYESIVRMVGDVCRDLELRCDEAEGPLREEQTRSHNLQSRLDTSEARVQQLEAEIQDQRLVLKNTEDENERICKKLQASEGRVEELSTNVSYIKREYEHAENEAERVAEAAAQSSRERDVAYMATLRSKDEKYEQQSSELASANKRIIDLERELEQAKAQEVDRNQSFEKKEADISNLQKLLATAETIKEAKDADIEVLKRTGERLFAEKAETQTRAKKAAEWNEDMIAALESDMQLAKDQASNIQRAFDAFTAAKAAEQANLEDSHKLLVAQLQEKIQNMNQEATMAKSDNESRITVLKRTIARLRQDRDQRAKEFAEAQDLSRRLMAVVGVNNAAATPAKNGYQSDDRSSPNGKKHRSSTSHVNSSVSFESGTSSRSGESSTPKRTKTQSSPPLSRNEHLNTATAMKDISRLRPFRARRPPLAESATVQNRRFTTSVLPTDRKQSLAPIVQSPGMLESAYLHHHTVSDDESFGGGDDIFTSTNQKQLSALRATAPLASYDETTAEF
ncbi:MAG: hypothetical protein Q9217_003900 [Psora testacea]